MNESVFIHLEFWLLMLASMILPVIIYFVLLRIRRISRYTVLLFGLALILLSALDVFLLQHLENAARATSSLLDDKVFVSEFSLALYLLPLLSAGVGVNIFSDVLLNHLRRVLHDVGARQGNR
jgi:cellulose synthase/poly-beta-1,6-N-acetylglucosamine synthase-like glycosyltransferase